jgi:hypothetical protein
MVNLKFAILDYQSSILQILRTGNVFEQQPAIGDFTDLPHLF